MAKRRTNNYEISLPLSLIKSDRENFSRCLFSNSHPLCRARINYLDDNAQDVDAYTYEGRIFDFFGYTNPRSRRAKVDLKVSAVVGGAAMLACAGYNALSESERLTSSHLAADPPRDLSTSKMSRRRFLRYMKACAAGVAADTLIQGSVYAVRELGTRAIIATGLDESEYYARYGSDIRYISNIISEELVSPYNFSNIHTICGIKSIDIICSNDKLSIL